MKYIVCEGAPPVLGEAGAIVELTASQAAYARLAGHVTPWREQPAAATPEATGEPVAIKPKKQRRRRAI